MVKLSNLEARSDIEEMVFHLKGLIEAAEEISTQAKLFDATLESDLEKATDVMGRLEAEIFTHLNFHMKELRGPFRKFFRTSCRQLEQAEKMSGTERRKKSE